MAEQAFDSSEQGVDEQAQIAKVTALALSKAIGSEEFAERLTLAIDALRDEAQLKFLSRGLSMAVVVLRDVEIPPKSAPEPRRIEMPVAVSPRAVERLIVPVQETAIAQVTPEVVQEPVLASKRVRNFFVDAFSTRAAELVTEDEVPALLETVRNLYGPLNQQPNSAARNMARLRLFADGLSDAEIIEAMDEHVAPNSVYANRGSIVKLLHRGYTSEQLTAAFKATLADGKVPLPELDRLVKESNLEGELDESAPANALALKFFTRVFEQDRLLAGITNAQAKELYEQVVAAYLSLNKKKQLAEKQAERLRLTVSGLTDEQIAEMDVTGETTIGAVYQGRIKLIEVVQRGRSKMQLATILDRVLNKETLLIPELEGTEAH